MQALYPSARDAFATGQVDWSSDSFYVVLCSGGYVYSDAHAVYDDLSDVLASAALPNPVVVGNGVLDADDVSVSGVGAGSVVERLIIVQDTGSPATDRLIYYADSQVDTTPIYRAGDGGPITFSWSNGAGRIMRI